MSLALPAGPQPTPSRRVTIGTAVFGAAMAALVGSMLSIWLKFRADAPTRESSDGLKVIKDWLPAKVAIPEVAANVLIITLIVVCVMAQWASYSARRKDRGHAAIALGMSAFLGLAALNAQFFIFREIGIGVADSAYGALFFAIGGVVALLIGIGVVYSVAAWFRVIGGRVSDGDTIFAHALYWYILTAACTAVWFVVYVQK
jgi:heme/copper-type cytochrome/quinol oxidase subunit 3